MPVDAGGTATLPAGVPLTRAGFRADGDDLLIVAEDGRAFRVDDYFSTVPRPDIATPAGSHLGPDIVDALLASPPAAPAPVFTAIDDVVGRVETLAGEAAVVHADGGREPVGPGMLLQKGDTLETAPDSGLGLGFPDGSGLALGGGGRLTLEELWFDADGGLGAARLFVGRGEFVVTPGELAAAGQDAFIVRTPTASLTVKGSAAGGVVESDGSTVATLFERADGEAAGGIVVRTQAGEVLLDRPGMAIGAEDLMLRPTAPFHLGPRDADGFFGDAIALVPNGREVFGGHRVERLGEHLEHPPVHAAADGPAPDLAAARAAVEQSLVQEQAARAAAEEARAAAQAARTRLEEVQSRAEQTLEAGEQTEQGFEAALAARAAAEQREAEAARAVAESDVVETEVADKLAAAEAALRKAMEAAEAARAEALKVVEDSEARDNAFQEAQALVASARAREAEAAEAAALHEATEREAAEALASAREIADAAAREAEAAHRLAAERATSAEVVSAAARVEAAEAGIDNLLDDPLAFQPAADPERWQPATVASMDVGATAIAAGEAAAKRAFNAALAEGKTATAALEAAILAADVAGGPTSVEMALAAGPQGLAAPGVDVAALGGAAGSGGTATAGAGGTFTGGFTAGTSADGVGADGAGADALIGGDAGDSLSGGFGSIDGGFAYGFRFEPPRLRFLSRADDDEERRDDPRPAGTPAAAASVAIILAGTAVDDLLAGDDGPTTVTALAGDDVIYGDTPTNLLLGTHTAASPLTDPAFAAGAADTIDGGAGADAIWGGPGADTLIGGDGDDTFHLGDDDAADDTVWGGREGADAGTDTADYSRAGAGVTVDLAAGTASGPTTGTDTLGGIENAIGSGYDDDLFGDAAANRLEGLDGADLIRGLGGDDDLFGFAGDDVLVGGTGNDVLAGGDGADQFTFEGGTGASVADRISSLGSDTIQDFDAGAGDTLVLSDADFGLGAAGSLSDGADYFETSTALSSTPLDLSGGASGPAMVVIGASSGDGGVDLYYTEDASAATASNSYQVARLDGIDAADIAAGDITLKA